MMTEAQRTTVEQNRNLVFAVVNKKFPWLMHDEDAISSGSLGLCKAAMTFDAEKGYAFSGYAWKCIYNEILMYLRVKQRQQTHESTFVFETEEKDDGEGEVLDFIGEDDKSFENFDVSQDLKKALETLPKRYRKTAQEYMNGKSLADIARETKRSRQIVSIEIQKMGRMLRERLTGYD